MNVFRDEIFVISPLVRNYFKRINPQCRLPTEGHSPGRIGVMVESDDPESGRQKNSRSPVMIFG